MRIRHLGVVAALVIFSTGVFAQTVDDIAKKYLDANGGASNLAAKKSMRMTCSIQTMGQSMSSTITKKRPNKLRTDVEVQGMQVTQAFDGQKAWTMLSMTPNASEMPPEQAASFRSQAVFDPPLVDWAARGYKIELVGKEPVNGKEAFKLAVTAPDGTAETLFMDAEKYLAVKTSTVIPTPQGNRPAEITFSDHRQIGGINTPHKVVTVIGNDPPIEMTIQKIEWNVEVPDSFFSMPKGVE